MTQLAPLPDAPPAPEPNGAGPEPLTGEVVPAEVPASLSTEASAPGQPERAASVAPAGDPIAPVAPQTAPKPPRAPRPKRPPLPAPVVIAAPPRLVRDWAGLLTVAFFSAVFGAALALLAVAGINGGALRLNEQREVLALTARAGQLEDRAAALEAEAQSLRTRLDALAGLTRRVDEAEAALDAQTAALERVETALADAAVRTDQLAADVAAARAAGARFAAFLEGLRALLSAGPGEAGGPVPTPTPTLAPTPVPSTND